jgi:phage terminase small subunit
MVSQRLKKHANELVYLKKARPCIRKHLITKADRTLVDCLCECADNILRGNVRKVESNGATTEAIGASRDPKNPPFHSIFERPRRLQAQTRGI